jgi:uncharacterized SAM-binding protein YcdF (DUF218 family)
MINFLFLVAGIACFAYYIGCGLSIRFGQSMLWAWPALGAALILRFIIVRMSISRGVPLPYPDWFLWTFRGVVAVCAAFFLFVESFILSGMFTQCPAGVDYLIVLGAKTGSKALNNRIAVAAEYLVENPATIAIASGGQGPDEKTTEAAFIADALIALGVPRERILIEDASTSTSENVRFSALLIPEAEATVALASNDFHIFRARHLAQKVFGHSVYGLPVRSSLISLPHYTMREFFTTVVDTLRGNMAYR